MGRRHPALLAMACLLGGLGLAGCTDLADDAPSNGPDAGDSGADTDAGATTAPGTPRGAAPGGGQADAGPGDTPQSTPDDTPAASPECQQDDDCGNPLAFVCVADRCANRRVPQSVWPAVGGGTVQSENYRVRVTAATVPSGRIQSPSFQVTLGGNTPLR